MKEDLNVNSVWKAVDVAISCMSSKSIDRPNMSQVVVDLKECLAMELAGDKNRQPETAAAESTALTGPFAR